MLNRYGRCDVLVDAAAMVASGPSMSSSCPRRAGPGSQGRVGATADAGFVPGMRDSGFGGMIFIVSDSYWRPPARMCSLTWHQKERADRNGAHAGGRAGRQQHRRNGRRARPDATPATDVVPAEEIADVAAHQPLPRPLTPDDGAAVMAMLAGDDAASLTVRRSRSRAAWCCAGCGPRTRPASPSPRRSGTLSRKRAVASDWTRAGHRWTTGP